MSRTNAVCRVTGLYSGTGIDVECALLNGQGTTRHDTYTKAEDMPDWLQERLAVIQACEGGMFIEDVGGRLPSDVFVVYPPDSICW